MNVLAPAPGHRMPRDEVLEMLWPRLAVDAAASNLHKAAGQLLNERLAREELQRLRSEEISA